jgi:pimeloyl-ACP methyl ester carboxylesterase
MTPDTHYAKSGDVNIAYQVVGDAPRDLVLVPGWVSNIEAFWEEPACARFLRRLASFARLILFDKRGTGLSDRVSDLPNLETRMDDLRTVMDTVGSARAALLGYSEGGPMCALFAATYPLRTSALMMQGSYARRTWAHDYPWGPTPEALGEWMAACQRAGAVPWGSTSACPAPPATSASVNGGLGSSGWARARAPTGRSSR